MRRIQATLFLITAIAAGTICRGAESPEAQLNRLIRPYSQQQIVGLDVGESYAFKLKSGDKRRVRVVSVQDHSDSVINLVRRSDVRVEIDGRPLDLVTTPYVMPTAIAGLRIQADTTSGYGSIAKRVQLSLWDAGDPIVDAKRFVFPIRNFRVLSHGTQGYNEPVHLGAGDDDRDGQRFYHDYGFDMGGYEGGETVLSPVEGKITLFWPSREDLCSAVVTDANGLNWELAHLASVMPNIVLGAHVAAGDPIGMLGRSGPSGNFSHLHVGTYLTKQDLDTDNRNRRLNLYPWMVAAYQSRHPSGLLAVARPHQIALTGEKVVFDGSHSLAWGGPKIVDWRWILPDGSEIRQAKAEATFRNAGAFVATLWVKDDDGNEDVDFCPAKVYTKDKPEAGIPHIYMTSTPTEDIRPGQPVRFRLWPQGKPFGSRASDITIDFGDGTKPDKCGPFSEMRHKYDAPGIYVVTAEQYNKSIVQKLKVVVTKGE
jgi:hypothetical protein